MVTTDKSIMRSKQGQCIWEKGTTGSRTETSLWEALSQAVSDRDSPCGYNRHVMSGHWYRVSRRTYDPIVP